jgi:hypothetical protein
MAEGPANCSARSADRQTLNLQDHLGVAVCVGAIEPSPTSAAYMESLAGRQAWQSGVVEVGLTRACLSLAKRIRDPTPKPGLASTQ